MKNSTNLKDTKQKDALNIRWMLVGYDLIVYAIVASILLAAYGGTDKLSSTGILQQVCLSAVCIFAARLLGKIYGQVWRYGGIQCYIRLLFTDGIAFLVYLCLELLLPIQKITFARMLSLVSLNLLGALALRMMYRYAYKCGNQETAKGKFLSLLLHLFSGVDAGNKKEVQKIKVAIIGAGRVGVSLAEELLNNEEAAYIPRCFIDIKKEKVGRNIHGIPVWSEDEATFNRLGEFEVQEIIFAIPSMNGNRKEHGWESDKKNGGVSVRVEFMVDTDISKDKKLMDVMPVSDLKDELNLEETPIVTGECADIISDYINVSHKVQEIYRQYQIYQEALGEWIHYDLDEDNHLVKKYSGAVIDKVTVNKMTKNILHEGMLLVRKAGAFVQKLGLQNETDFLADSMGDNLGFEFMVLAAIYMDHGHWAVEFENGDSFYNLLEMCTVLRTADEEDSADLLKTFTLLKNEMEEQGMDIRHIDHYNMLRNYIYTVADIYKIFFDAIQKKLEAMVVEIDSLVDKNPDFIATEGKFKGCIFYQTDTDSNSVDVFDPSGNIMADFSIFQSEAIRNYEKTRLGIQGAVEHN